MHSQHHSAASDTRLMTLGAALMLAACGQLDTFSQLDWPTQVEMLKQPGPLGMLFDRRPPAVWIRAGGPYPGPLSEPVQPLIAPDVADQVVAAPLRALLTPEARLNLAKASMLAASAATGTEVTWKSADASGAVAPARDVYLSHRGLVCRDLQQGMQKADRKQIAQVTLCHEDLGDNRVLWLPGLPD